MILKSKAYISKRINIGVLILGKQFYELPELI